VLCTNPAGGFTGVISAGIIRAVSGDNFGSILAIHKNQEKIGEMGRSSVGEFI